MYKNIKLLVVIIFLLVIGNYRLVYANSLTLEDCIKIAHEKSPAAKIAKNDYENRRQSNNAFNADYLPQLSLSGSLPGLQREISEIIQPDGTQLFLPQSQMYGSGNLSISQKLPFTGGNISVSTGVTRLDYWGKNNTYYWRTSPVQITFNQPIFSFNSMKWNREIEELRNINNKRMLAEAMEDISIDVTQKFFDAYIGSMNLKNAAMNVSINDSLYQISKGRFIVGTIAENDLLQSELGLMNVQNDFDYTQLSYSRAVEMLKIALGLELSDSLALEPPTHIPNINIEPEVALQQAKKNRSDFIQYKILELQADMELNRTERNNGFNANLSASYGVNQTAGSIPDAYKDLLDAERLNIGFSVPLFQWGKGSSEIEAAMASQESVKSGVENQKRYFELDVKYQALNFLQYQKQLAISAKADTVAARRFNVAKNRYLIGKIDLNTYFIAQNEKDTALRNYYQTLQNFWVAYYRLRRLTLYDFERGEAIEYEKN